MKHASGVFLREHKVRSLVLKPLDNWLGFFFLFLIAPAGSRGRTPLLVRSGVSGLQVTYAADEKMLFDVLVTIMRRCVQLFYEREPRAELLQL